MQELSGFCKASSAVFALSESTQFSKYSYMQVRHSLQPRIYIYLLEGMRNETALAAWHDVIRPGNCQIMLPNSQWGNLCFF